MNSAIATVRWLASPLLAALALWLGFAIPLIIYAMFFGPGLKSMQTGASFFAFTAAIILGATLWTGAGTLAAPPQHRRLAFWIFSAPVFLITALILIGLLGMYLSGAQLDPTGRAIVVGFPLACAGMVYFASREFIKSPART